MPTEQVIERVRAVRAGLTQAKPSDAAELQQAIDTVLIDPAHAPHYAGLRERLHDAQARMEAEHPELAATMLTLIKALDSVGL